MASLRPDERQAWWKRSRRLTHGTLAALCAEPDGPSHPVLVIAQIVERDPEQLAARGKGSRPVIGLRWVDACS